MYHHDRPEVSSQQTVCHHDNRQYILCHHNRPDVIVNTPLPELFDLIDPRSLITLGVDLCKQMQHCVTMETDDSFTSYLTEMLSDQTYIKA